MKRGSYSVSEADSGKRVDVFLMARELAASRTAIQKWIEDGRVLLNGAPTKSSHKLKRGDLLDVDEPPKSAPDNSLEPWIQPIDILYEDDILLAVRKPPGMITHPGAGNRSKTLVNALIVLRPEIAGVGHPLRPGIVHRLDRETSGLLLVAKTDRAYHAITTMFKLRQIEKHYRALTFGVWPQTAGRIDKPLGRDPGDRKRISTRARKSRTAVTLYRVLKQGGSGALLDVHILTGRTHQIRVHLSSENHPIVGDSKYGGGNWVRITDPQLRAHLKQAGFFGLHAYSLSFSHPASNAQITLECPLPDSWTDALKILD